MSIAKRRSFERTSFQGTYIYIYTALYCLAYFLLRPCTNGLSWYVLFSIFFYFLFIFLSSSWLMYLTQLLVAGVKPPWCETIGFKAQNELSALNTRLWAATEPANWHRVKSSSGAVSIETSAKPPVATTRCHSRESRTPDDSSTAPWPPKSIDMSLFPRSYVSRPARPLMAFSAQL